MANGRIAELFLSLVLPADRAASVVGDFLEDAGGKGKFRIRIIGTFLANLWNGFAESPFTLLILAVRGFVLSVLASWSVLVAVSLAMLPALAVFAILGVMKTQVPGWLRETSTIVSCLFGLGVQFLCQFQTGRWVARRAAGKEVAVALGVCLPQLVIFREIGNPMQILLASLFSYPHPDTHPTMPVIVVCKVAYVVAICAGAVSIRFELRGATAA